MHPDILRQLAAEHTRDLITEAGEARRAREARHAQRRRRPLEGALPRLMEGGRRQMLRPILQRAGRREGHHQLS